MAGKNRRRRNRLLQLWGDRCLLCGRPFGMLQPTVEHLIPSSKAGTNQSENLALSHMSCNNKRGNGSLVKAMLSLEACPPETVRRHERRARFADGSLVEREW